MLDGALLLQVNFAVVTQFKTTVQVNQNLMTLSPVECQRQYGEYLIHMQIKAQSLHCPEGIDF